MEGGERMKKKRNEHKHIDALSLFFFIIFFALIIVGQFYINDRVIGIAMGMGLASLFCHATSMKLDSGDDE